MKKALIAALLVACAAFAPYPGNLVESRDPVCEVASAFASPLFWHLWDELLTRELARWTETASRGGDQPEWRPVLRSDALVCLFFHVFLSQDSLYTAEKNNNGVAVSIRRSVVRRRVEREFTPVPGHQTIERST